MSPAWPWPLTFLQWSFGVDKFVFKWTPSILELEPRISECIRSIGGKIIFDSSPRQKCKQKLLAFSLIRQPREPCASTRLHMRAGAPRAPSSTCTFMPVRMDVFECPACVTERNLVASMHGQENVCRRAEGPGKPTWLREMTFFRRGSSGSRMFAVDRTLLFRRCRISRRDTNHAPYALFAPRKSAQPVSRKLAVRGEN